MKATLNLARENKYQFFMQDLPILSNLVQSIDIEALALNEVPVNTPYLDIPKQGEKIVYGNFDVMYLVDENMDAYTEVYNYMNAMCGVYSIREERREFDFQASVLVYDNSLSKIVRTIKFEDCFPILLGNLAFDNTGSDPKQSSVTFTYSSFSITPTTSDTTGFENYNNGTEIYPEDPFV